MKFVFYLFISIVLVLSCAGNKGKEKRDDVHVDPIVQKWMDTDHESAGEILPVIVAASEPVKDYEFLKNISENYYTGRVTKAQLKKLLSDPRIKNISSGTEQIH